MGGEGVEKKRKRYSAFPAFLRFRAFVSLGQQFGRFSLAFVFLSARVLARSKL